MKKLLIPLALLANACGVAQIGPNDRVSISTSFSASEIETIAAAADEWAKATRGRVGLRLVIDDTLDGHVIVPAPTAGAEYNGKLASTIVQEGLEPDVIIRIDTAKIRRFAAVKDWDASVVTRSVVAHELGHGMGLTWHGSHGLMAEYPDLSQPCVDAESAKRVCDIHVCPDGYISTCEAS